MQIIKTIPRVMGYIDTTGNGCNLACETNLRNGSVDYIDVVFAADRYQALIAEGGSSAVSFRLPSRDGIFRATLVGFKEIEKSDADFEMRGVFSRRTTSWGRSFAVAWTFVRRESDDVIATAKDNHFVWDKKRLVVPDLPPDYSCVTLHESIIDLRRVYASADT